MAAIETPLVLMDREGWIHVFDSVEQAIVEIEAPDVETDEYLVFDASGRPVEAYVVAVEGRSPWWRRIREQPPIDFRPSNDEPDPRLLQRMLSEALDVDEGTHLALPRLLDLAVAAPGLTLQAPLTAAQIGHQP